MVSVIIPIYNAEKTLAKCVNSVLSQTYKDIQVILINDGSTDGSLEICRAYAGKAGLVDSRHQGVASARNIGLMYALGKYVCFLDADDYFIDNYVLQSLVNSSADLVIGGFRRDYLNKAGIRQYAREYLLSPNKSLEFAYCWGKLFRRSIIEDNKIQFRFRMAKYEDTAFVFNYLYYAHDVLITGNPTVNHSCPVDGAGMQIFDSSADCEELLTWISVLGMDKELLNHARVSLKIIEIVRAYRLPFMSHYLFIVGLLDNPLIRKSFKSYEWIPGNSRLIPLLIKFRLYLLLTIICRVRGKKRYG